MRAPIPFTRPAEWPARPPGRFAARIDLAADTDPSATSDDVYPIALLGLPDDTGVRLNGGRSGAAQGPRAFRAALARFGATWDLQAGQPLDVRILDAGDVEPAAGDDHAALLETHARVEAAARALHQQGCVTVAIGGGHDLALPCIAAFARHQGRAVGGINLDAHLDVRERVGSGMPFRRLITGGHLDPRAFVELGLGRFANDRADVEWARAQGARLIAAPAVDTAPAPLAAFLAHALGPGAGFVSIDLDAIDAAYAPGVSAPSPLGLGVHHASALAEAAGGDPRVGHFDIMELCPPHDPDGRTARVAALLFLSFVAGWRARAA
jgi:formiminoglutamase